MYLETAEDTAPRIERELTETLKIAQKNQIKILKQTFANIAVPTTLANLTPKTRDDNNKLTDVRELHQTHNQEPAAH